MTDYDVQCPICGKISSAHPQIERLLSSLRFRHVITDTPEAPKLSHWMLACGHNIYASGWEVVFDTFPGAVGRFRPHYQHPGYTAVTHPFALSPMASRSAVQRVLEQAELNAARLRELRRQVHPERSETRPEIFNRIAATMEDVKAVDWSQLLAGDDWEPEACYCNAVKNPPCTWCTHYQEDEEMTTQQNQTAELREKLQAARNKREMDQKIEQAGAIVNVLDSLPAASVIRFSKLLPANRGLPEKIYLYVAVKPEDNGPWYTTGSESGPLNSDDLAAFMLAGVPTSIYQLLAGEAAQTWDVSPTPLVSGVTG